MCSKSNSQNDNTQSTQQQSQECSIVKFVHRNHTLCFCFAILIVIILYGIFLFQSNKNLKESQAEIVNTYKTIQESTDNSITFFINQSLDNRNQLQSMIYERIVQLSNAQSKKNTIPTEKLLAQIYTDFECLKTQNDCILNIATDSLTIQYDRLAASIMSEKMLELHLDKIEHEYTNITIWAAVLTIVFLIFSFFSLFKIEQSRKEIEDLKENGENEINNRIKNFDETIEFRKSSMESDIESHKSELETLVQEYSAKLTTLDAKLKMIDERIQALNEKA